MFVVMDKMTSLMNVLLGRNSQFLGVVRRTSYRCMSSLPEPIRNPDINYAKVLVLV